MPAEVGSENLGLTSFRFFGDNFRGEMGSGAPEALPTLTIVALRRTSSKLFKNLRAIKQG